MAKVTDTQAQASKKNVTAFKFIFEDEDSARKFIETANDMWIVLSIREHTTTMRMQKRPKFSLRVPPVLRSTIWTCFTAYQLRQKGSAECRCTSKQSSSCDGFCPLHDCPPYYLILAFLYLGTPLLLFFYFFSNHF